MSEKQTKLFFLESKAKCKIQSVFTLLSSDVSSSWLLLHPRHPTAPTRTCKVPGQPGPQPVWPGTQPTGPHLILSFSSCPFPCHMSKIAVSTSLCLSPDSG